MIKVNKCLLLFIIFCFFRTIAFSNPFTRLDSVNLAKTKTMIENGTASLQTFAAYKNLINEADKLLDIKNPTVVDKTILPPTENKHDYLSISRYWWPDPDKQNGLPWIRHDGKTNPDTQTDAVDRQRLSLMGKGVWKLSLAYYFTNNEKYAKKAISMLETWFINPETFMNPHLEFAQSVPGNPNKRRAGILDGRSITMFIPDALTLLSISENWNINHTTKMTKWLTDFLKWLTTSDLGIQGSKQENNHGSWYKYQVASLALYLGEIELAKNMVELAQESLEAMLNDEGGQIHELARTKSFSYSCFNLEALTDIAVIGDKIGMNMWEYKSENKKSLALAIDYLTPVINGKKWEHATLKEINIFSLAPILAKIPPKYNSKKYKSFLNKILQNINEEARNENLQEFWLLNANNY